MKAKIGQTVYTIYSDSITKHTVYMIGEDSFLVDGYEFLKGGAREYNYINYGITWFKSIDKAIAYLKKYLDDKSEIVQLEDDYWEVLDKDETNGD